MEVLKFDFWIMKIVLIFILGECIMLVILFGMFIIVLLVGGGFFYGDGM